MQQTINSMLEMGIDPVKDVLEGEFMRESTIDFNFWLASTYANYLYGYTNSSLPYSEGKKECRKWIPVLLGRALYLMMTGPELGNNGQIS